LLVAFRLLFLPHYEIPLPTRRPPTTSLLACQNQHNERACFGTLTVTSTPIASEEVNVDNDIGKREKAREQLFVLDARCALAFIDVRYRRYSYLIFMVI